MDKMVIVGGQRLAGSIRVSGAKNAALPLLAASILAPGRNVFHNVPRLGDLRTMAKCLAIMGADVDLSWPDVVVDTRELVSSVAPYELVKTMRAAILVLGPLVARMGHAQVSLPGGCAIGARPIDLHLMGLEAMGAHVEIRGGYVHVDCKRLQGAHIRFPQPTVGGTENLMMAATLADGITTLVVSTAIESNNPDVLQAGARGISVQHRAAMLASLFNSSFGIGIAGTSGKSTVTGMVASILDAAGKDPTVVKIGRAHV